LSEAVNLRFEEDFKKEEEKFLNMQNTSLFILDKKRIEIPAVISSTDRIMTLGLFNTDFRQPFMFHQKIHNFSSKPDDQYCFLKNISL